VLAVLLQLSAAMFVLGGCVPPQQGPSGEHGAAQGQVYQSFNPAYDELFQEVHELDVQATGAFEHEAKARAPLEQALGARATTPEHLADLARTRAKKASQEGAPVHLSVERTAPVKEGDKSDKSLVVTFSVPDEAAVPANEREFVKALEQSARAEAEIVNKYDPISARARKLQVRLAELSVSVNQDFTVPSRRDEVVRELGASKAVLDGIADRTQKVSTNATAFLKQITEALDPAALASEKPSPAKSHAKPRRAAAAPARPEKIEKPEKLEKPEKPAAASASPPPKPEPPQPPAEDFNP